MSVFHPTALFQTFSKALKDAFDPSSRLFYWIWGAMVAVLLAMILSAVYRAVVGLPIRRLQKENALSPDRAKTLRELGCDNFFFRFLLRPSAVLRNVVHAVTDTESVQNCAESTDTEQDSTDFDQSASQDDTCTTAESNNPSNTETDPTLAPKSEKVTDSTAFYLKESQLYRVERTFAVSKQAFWMIPLCGAVLFGLGLLLFWLLPAAI